MECTVNIKDFILDKFIAAKVPEQTLEIVFENEAEILQNNHGQEKCNGLSFPFSRSQLQNVTVKHSNYLIRNDNMHNKDIMEVTLDIKNFKEFEWQPGDTIGILPSNTKEIVSELLELLDLNGMADRKCSVKVVANCIKKTAKAPPYIPTTTSPREIIQDCLNIKSILKKQFLSSLAEYCTDKEEKSFLKCLSSKEGSSFYNFVIAEKSFTILDVLKSCPSCKPPLWLLIEHLTRLLPRPYSIANSPLKTVKDITVIFSILNKNPGVTTNMMKEKTRMLPSSLLIYLREYNLFRYTEEDYSKNQILIAIGTGLAPFLGFLQHKECIMKSGCNSESGKTWLFVGSTSEQSILHREQLVKWQSMNVLNKFIESHSRVNDAPYQYIQDSLHANSQEFVELFLHPNTVTYICADGAQISKSIEVSIHKILTEELTISEMEAVDMLKSFKAKGKYREDLCSTSNT